MSACLFCDIVHQRCPARIIYQTETVICFLPRVPEAYGHTLIVPKKHVPDIYAASETLLGELMAAAKKLALHYRTQIQATGVNLLHASGAAAQQSVPHFHLHLLPRFDQDGLNAWPQLPKADFDLDALLQKLQLGG